MAQSDAYAASSGWGRGSPLTSSGGLLGSYMQKMQTVSPSTGSLSMAQPASVNQHASSLARVVNPATDAQAPLTAPAPAPQAAVPAIAQVAAQTATQTAQALGQGLTSGGLTPGQAAPTSTGHLGLATTTAADFTGPRSFNARASDGTHVGVTYDPKTNQFIAPSYSVLISLATDPAQKASLIAQDNMARSAAAAANQQFAGQLQARAQSLQATQAQNQEGIAAQQTAHDKAAADAAQLQADQASAFNLGGSLQAPNTSEIDRAGQNSLNSVASQYASGLSGADSRYYNFSGQGAQSTQQAVNQVNHDTAYAKSYNDNYGLFSSALQGQQGAHTNATGQQLNLDMQGVTQALSSLQQQASQLDAATQTKVNAQIIPLQNALSQYQNAVKDYGVDSSQAAAFAKAVFSLGGSAIAGAV